MGIMRFFSSVFHWYVLTSLDFTNRLLAKSSAVVPVSKAMTLCKGKRKKYSNEIVVTEVYGVCGEEYHEI